MQKSRLGISVGMLGAAVYFAGFFGGVVATIILAGYILLCEDNPWLRRTAVKAAALMFGFAVLSACVGLIPNPLDVINDFMILCDESFSSSSIDKIINFVESTIVILEKIAFLVLGINALKMGNVAIPVIDPMVDKHIG